MCSVCGWRSTKHKRHIYNIKCKLYLKKEAEERKNAQENQQNSQRQCEKTFELRIGTETEAEEEEKYL